MQSNFQTWTRGTPSRYLTAQGKIHLSLCRCCYLTLSVWRPDILSSVQVVLAVWYAGMQALRWQQEVRAGNSEADFGSVAD